MTRLLHVAFTVITLASVGGCSSGNSAKKSLCDGGTCSAVDGPVCEACSESVPGYNATQCLADGNQEFRLCKDGQHFGSIILTAAGALSIRPHPGKDPNGWGSSLYLHGFLSGQTVLAGASRSVVDILGAVGGGEQKDLAALLDAVEQHQELARKPIMGYGATRNAWGMIVMAKDEAYEKAQELVEARRGEAGDLYQREGTQRVAGLHRPGSPVVVPGPARQPFLPAFVLSASRNPR